MNTFIERLKFVPRSAWMVGLLLAVILTLPLALGPMRFDAEMRAWPLVAKAALLIVLPIFILAYALLIGFVYADAKRRHMRHVMWAWLAVVPYFVGVILYFILRDPLPTLCRQCRGDVPQVFAFCPHCGGPVHPTCPQCGKTMELGWSNCPHCGIRLTTGQAIVV